jgi:hypothetical protein
MSIGILSDCHDKLKCSIQNSQRCHAELKGIEELNRTRSSQFHQIKVQEGILFGFSAYFGRFHGGNWPMSSSVPSGSSSARVSRVAHVHRSSDTADDSGTNQ